VPPETDQTNAAGEHDLEWAYGQAVAGQGQAARVAIIFGPDGRRGANDDPLRG
jgi:hypothetical protein